MTLQAAEVTNGLGEHLGKYSIINPDLLCGFGSIFPINFVLFQNKKRQETNQSAPRLITILQTSYTVQ